MCKEGCLDCYRLIRETYRRIVAHYETLKDSVINQNLNHKIKISQKFSILAMCLSEKTVISFPGLVKPVQSSCFH